jgi:hypothetical protein
MHYIARKFAHGGESLKQQARSQRNNNSSGDAGCDADETEAGKDREGGCIFEPPLTN